MLSSSHRDKAVKLLIERYSTDEMETKEVVELAYSFAKYLTKLPSGFKTEHLTSAEDCAKEYRSWKERKDKKTTLKQKITGSKQPRLTGEAKRFWEPYTEIRDLEEKFDSAKQYGLAGKTSEIFDCLYQAGVFAGTEAQKVANGRRIFQRMKDTPGVFYYFGSVEYDIF